MLKSLFPSLNIDRFVDSVIKRTKDVDFDNKTEGMSYQQIIMGPLSNFIIDCIIDNL